MTSVPPTVSVPHQVCEAEWDAPPHEPFRLGFGAGAAFERARVPIRHAAAPVHRIATADREVIRPSKLRHPGSMGSGAGDPSDLRATAPVPRGGNSALTPPPVFCSNSCRHRSKSAPGLDARPPPGRCGSPSPRPTAASHRSFTVGTAVHRRPVAPALLLCLAAASGCRGGGASLADRPTAGGWILPASARLAEDGDAGHSVANASAAEAAAEVTTEEPAGRSRWSRVWPFERSGGSASAAGSGVGESPAVRPSVELPRVVAEADDGSAAF